MKENELRVYNYIYKKIHKKDTPLEVVEVLSIDGSFDVLDVKNIEGYITEKCPLKDFEPIPLTEEWLFKFGFHLDPYKNYELNNVFIHRLTFTLDIFEDDDWHHIPVKLKYVHQLQGLYFYLTGEELTIKQE